MNTKKCNITQSGFTLMEMIVVLSIIVILTAVSVPFYNFFQSFGALNSSKQEVLENIRLTRSKALSGENNSSFGVYFSSNKYTIYQGDSYAGRDQSQDFINELPAGISFSGLSEIRFTLKTGLPSAAGTLTMTSASDNSTSSISVNSAGLIY